MQTAIRTPGSVWAKLIEQSNANAKKPEGRGDAFVYFVGSRGCGKSTLLNRFLYPSRVEVPKPSEGLEYTYARKPSQFDHEKKDLAHIWEFGGSQELAEGMAKGEQLFLTAKQVTTAVVVVVVDLSDPGGVINSLLGWLKLIQDKLAATYEKFEKKGLQLPEQLRQRAKSKLYGGNEDKDLVYHSGISLVIAATKYDRLQDQEPELKKIMARTLRYIAHAHGAFLVYTGGLQDSSLDKPMADNLDRFTKLLNHLIFTGLEKKPAKMEAVTDHGGPVMVSAGIDKFRDIGRPRGGGDGNVQAGQQEWRELFDKMFPPKAAAKAAKFQIDERYKEEEVDLMSKRKMQELEAFRKEQENSKKLEAFRKERRAGPSGGGAASSPSRDSTGGAKALKSTLAREGGRDAGEVRSSRSKVSSAAVGQDGGGGVAAAGGGGELRSKPVKERSSKSGATEGEDPAPKKKSSKIKAAPES